MYQIRKFLIYYGIKWINEIKLPVDPIYQARRISKEEIQQTISFFKDHQYFIQIKALILLGSTSGMRAEELYQLRNEDIDIDDRLVYINHNSNIGQTTKTGRSRISFFNVETQKALCEYINYFNNDSGLKKLFSQTHITHIFRSSTTKVKELRKFFSQEWSRNGGSTGIKKILMGHSTRNDVDLCHYNAQSPDDLKKIYDKVMVDFI